MIPSSTAAAAVLIEVRLAADAAGFVAEDDCGGPPPVPSILQCESCQTIDAYGKSVKKEGCSHTWGEIGR